MPEKSKSGILALLLGKPKGETEETEEKPMSSKAASADAILSAIAEKDAEALAEALEAFVSCCSEDE